MKQNQIWQSIQATCYTAFKADQLTLTRELRTAVPAIVSDIITMRLVKKANTQKTTWVLIPNRALMTYKKGCAIVTKKIFRIIRIALIGIYLKKSFGAWSSCLEHD